MISDELDEEIKVINKCENLSEEYTIYFQQEIIKNNMELLSIKKADEKFITNIKIKEDYLIFLSTKTSKNLSEINPNNEKNIKIIGFEITIIKLNYKKGDNVDDKEEININIPLKEPKLIPYKTIYNQKYFFYDFIKINDIKNYLHIYAFDQLHIFKIYQKENQLKYNKIELKKFNEKTKVLYLGEYFKSEENKLEISLLLKPMNNFLFLQIDTDEKNLKTVEKLYEFNDKKYKNILYKFIRSYCGMFLFFEKETNKKYIIYKEENNENNTEILIKEVQISILDNNIKENFFYYLYNISNKLYLISELSQETDEDINSNFIVLAIFCLFYDKEKDIYNSQLIQKIIIKNEGGIKDYNITINSLNYLSIQINDILFCVHLDQNSSVDVINKYYLNFNNLQILRNVFDKSNDCGISLSYIKDKFYISKFYDDKENFLNGKCIINYESINNENSDEKIDEKDYSTERKTNEKDEITKIIDKLLNKNDENKNITIERKKENDEQKEEELSNGIKTKIENYIDRIINDRIKINNEKYELIKKDFNNRFEMIRKDIELQEKENEKLGEEIKNILNHISELKKVKNISNNDNEEDDKEKEENTKNYNFKNFTNKNDFLNYLQFNSLRQLNQMKMMNQYNLMNLEGFYNPMQFNEQMFPQLFQFNKRMMNQGNYLFKNKNIKKNEFH